MKAKHFILLMSLLLWSFIIVGCGAQSSVTDSSVSESQTISYRTEHLYGCTFSVPEEWILDETGNSPAFYLNDNCQILFSFYSLNDGNWDGWKVNMLSTLRESGSFIIKGDSDLKKGNNSFYCIEMTNLEGNVYASQYSLNASDLGVLSIFSASSVESNPYQVPIDKMLESVETSGVSEYIASLQKPDENQEDSEVEESASEDSEESEASEETVDYSGIPGSDAVGVIGALNDTFPEGITTQHGSDGLDYYSSKAENKNQYRYTICANSSNEIISATFTSYDVEDTWFIKYCSTMPCEVYSDNSEMIEKWIEDHWDNQNIQECVLDIGNVRYMLIVSDSVRELSIGYMD